MQHALNICASLKSVVFLFFIFDTVKDTISVSYHEHRRWGMKSKTVTVHCNYCEKGKDISEILLESFRLFLKKELLSLDIGKGL